MKSWAWLAMGAACLAGAAHGADYGSLRTLNAPPPSRVGSLPEGSKPQPLEFVRVVVQPRNGEAWAIASSGGPLLDEAGQVIGLTVSGQTANGAPVGLNFFIPIDDALKALSLTLAG